MHKIGAMILEKYLNMCAGNFDGQAKCAQGHQIKYMEIREKEIMTVLGKIVLKRKYYYDKECKQGCCPKDEELRIEGTSFSPGVQRMMVRAGSNRPFALSQEDISEFAGLEINAKEVERYCQQLGKEAEEYINQMQPRQEHKAQDILYINMDGTGVPMVPEETQGRIGKSEDGRARTREAKLGCIFTQTTTDQNNNPIRQENSTTYVGGISTTEEFNKLINEEASRRGIDKAKKVCVLGDGALWIWNIAKDRFFNATEIVDLFHAREHYWEPARLVFPAGSKSQSKWIDKRREQLDNGKVELVIRAIKRLKPKTIEAKQVCQKAVHYFEQNKHRMRYDKFRAQGLFVGSGVIEAGCRTIVAQRLKQSGMHWTVAGANSIITLRCLLQSRRWEDFWEFRAAA